MTHIPAPVLERLFARKQDLTICVHGVRSWVIPRELDSVVVVRIVGHLALEVPAEDDTAEVPEEFALVLDLPMAPETVAMISTHFDETMGQVVDSALERLITEDGET